MSHNAISATEAIDALNAAVSKIMTYPLSLVLHGNQGVERPMAFPSGAVKKFKPRLLNPRPEGIVAVAAEEEKEVETVIKEIKVDDSGGGEGGLEVAVLSLIPGVWVCIYLLRDL